MDGVNGEQWRHFARRVTLGAAGAPSGTRAGYHLAPAAFDWPADVPLPRCAAGHVACTVPEGWDPEHSDQQDPYTLEQLAARPRPPHPGAYADDVKAYLFAWQLWKSLQRDNRLTAAERAYAQPWHDRQVAVKLLPQMPGWTVDEIVEWLGHLRGSPAEQEKAVDLVVSKIVERRGSAGA
ncbi:hypothetical protein [Actinoplanes sp. URMC 104]|uniref:hypothetical protein n=1 Tax=Actinoplanes sp. URMC 104 TaxID=3423409 RepID=UPI003F1D9D4D